MFGDLIVKWKESLSFYKWDSLKLFILVSLNNLFKAFVLFIKKFWWMSLLTGFFIALFALLFPASHLIVGETAKIFFYLFLFIPVTLISISLLFVMVTMPYLLLRASSESKDFEYLKKYMPKIIIFFSILIFFILIIAIFLLLLFKETFLFKENLALIIGDTKYLFFASLFGVIIDFTVFLFLDSKKKFVSIFSSFVKAFKAFIYFLPVTIFFGVFYFITGLIRDYVGLNMKNMFDLNFYIVSILLAFVYLLLYIANYLLTISFVANYYTILRHKYYSFFYKEN